MSADRTDRYDVWLGDTVVGALDVTGDHTRFSFVDGYWRDPSRSVLGLRFEDVPGERTSAALRVPPWFSNLLPEGVLREWVSGDAGVASPRELPLLVRLGADLPGAVRVLPSTGAEAWDPARDPGTPSGPPQGAGTGTSWRFSLAGVGLKFSMAREDDRLVLPATGRGGDWIVKLPDATHSGLPVVEMAVMDWAAAVGIEVPERLLVHRDAVHDLPDAAWPTSERWAYAVRRFDRREDRSLVHIEDLNQVRGFWPEDRYRGTYETVAGLVHRRRDDASLQELVRRIVFCVIAGNGDAHLKNFSLIYPDGRTPRLSPAYDLVCTAAYAPRGSSEDLALTFNRSKRFADAGWRGLQRWEDRLHVQHLDLVGTGAAAAEAALRAWPEARESLALVPHVQQWLDGHVATAAAQFLPS